MKKAGYSMLPMEKNNHFAKSLAVDPRHFFVTLTCVIFLFVTVTRVIFFCKGDPRQIFFLTVTRDIASSKF